MALVIGQIKLGNLWRSQTEILNLVVSHIHRYPELEVRDVYKLLYQGAMGQEHLMNDAPRFEQRLTEEFESVSGNDNAPLWENLRPDGEIVRLNLAPYKIRNGNPGTLYTLCLWTASSFKGNSEDLKMSWETFNKLCNEGRLRKFDPEELSKLNEWLERHDYPPIHHSDRYRQAYQPAYRLIRREFLNLATIEK